MNRAGIRGRWISLWVSLGLLGLSGAVMACRYNVRDIGFVDLEATGYTLFVYPETGLSEAALRTLQQEGRKLELESNIRLELVDAKRDPDHPGWRYRPASPAAPQALRNGVLLAPGGQTLEIPLPVPNGLFPEACRQVFQQLGSSPKRSEIQRSVSQTFAAILLIEGSQTSANGRARSSIESAIQEIRGQMKSLPKVIAEAPVMLSLGPPEFAAEKILAWSLGLELPVGELPIALVLYGKGRWIGKPLRGEEITIPGLLKTLSIIGADCECGLDISWTQGVRLPMRWAEDSRGPLAQSLGFDPENPLVKLEASRILSKRGSGTAKSLGYQEVTLDDGPSTPAPSGVSQVNTPAPSSATGPQPARSPANIPDSGRRPAWIARSWAVGGGLGLILVGVGLVVFLRSRVKD